MRTILLEKIKSEHPTIHITAIRSTRHHITNYPCEGIMIAVKSDSWGIFVFSFHKLKVFSNINPSIVKHFTKWIYLSLKSPNYPNVTFRLATDSIYVYLHGDFWKNDEFATLTFNQVVAVIKDAVPTLESEINKYLAEQVKRLVVGD